MIIGITGSFGAGKGVVVDYLSKTRGFKHYSASGFIKEEIVRRGLPVDRDSMILIGNAIRAEYGPAYIIETLYKRAEEAGGDAVIEALRAVAEAKKIKELGGLVIGVDADSKLRYERAFARKSEKDNVPYDKWLEQERIENNATDPTRQNISGALKESDVIVTNNGTPEELFAQVEEALQKIK
ncbi:MAG TPA: AAA family ATPase [Candidatus Paceibacterota bacterium]|nr:AAA family ATPase [Candidatus Paceibacterota bacterium]